MKQYLNGIGQTVATFAAEGGLQGGQVCRVAGNSTVGPCAEGEDFCGFAEQCGPAGAAVVLRGFVRVPYSGAAPETGRVGLSADGSGGVKADEAAAAYLVVHVDSAAARVTILL